MTEGIVRQMFESARSSEMFLLFIVSQEICFDKKLEYLVSCFSIYIGLLKCLERLP